MAKSYTLVALPETDSEVWKLSSEKVPHLTILFLGENLEEANRVLSFIKHAADKSLRPFYLDVERRGILGDKGADVLFFRKSDASRVAEFRQYLLMEPNILAAYESVDQFPKWIPHLTMGYPETPAKEDDGHRKVHTVRFDRIALWEDDYEGVEFPLTNHDEQMELSMSDKGKAFLEHYGVKGMRWGVIRNDDGSVSPKKATKAAVSGAVKVYSPSKDAVSAKKAQVKAQLGGVKTMSNSEMRHVINRMKLEKEYRELYGEHQLHDVGVALGKRLAKRGAKWAGSFLRDVGTDVATSWLKRPGSNASGRTSARAWDTGQQFGRVIAGTVAQKAIGS